MGVLTHHKKGIRALASHPSEFTFATGSTSSIKQWKCPEGAFMQNFEGHNAIINTLSVNNDNIMFSGGDNGSMSFWVSFLPSVLLVSSVLHFFLFFVCGAPRLKVSNRTGRRVIATKLWTPSHSPAPSTPKMASSAPPSTSPVCDSFAVRRTRQSKYGDQMMTRRPRRTPSSGSRRWRGDDFERVVEDGAMLRV